jgi:hypothetical protein
MGGRRARVRKHAGAFLVHGGALRFCLIRTELYRVPKKYGIIARGNWVLFFFWWKSRMKRADTVELSKEERELKSKRKMIQEKLIKFATRIPIFMYLSDYRELSLEDVITRLEPELFRKVTGLSVDDFDLLRSLNLFNGPLMNDAVWKFKRYEDASLEYTGIDSKHDSEKDVGLFNTVITKDEYLKLAEDQRRSVGRL